MTVFLTQSLQPRIHALVDPEPDPASGPDNRQETLRGFYDQPAEDAEEFLDELITEFSDGSHPPEVRSLGRTLNAWRDQILAWHQARVSNGPTESINNLIKRIKRIGFGFRRSTNYRTRVLLYAGKPNWDLLATITPTPPP